MNKNTKKRIVYLIWLLVGLFLGWILFSKKEQPKTNIQKDHKKQEVYTCPMHPQIRESKRGKCPICGMDLVPISDTKTSLENKNHGSHIEKTDTNFSHIQTIKVQKSGSNFEIPLSGRISIDQEKRSSITANFPGRIEKLFINSIGKEIYKGDILAYIYSPELLLARKELQEAYHLKNKAELYEAIKNKLKFWGLTEIQIKNMLNSNEDFYPIYAQKSGVVTNQMIKLGDYVKTGSVLAEVVDLSKIWVLFDGYERDLRYIKKGSEIEFHTQSLPNRIFKAELSYISPILDKSTGVVELRVELKNPNSILKPGMFVSGKLKTNNKTAGVKIPKSAILWKGDQSVVYKKNSHGNFEAKEINLGNNSGEFYFVESGLNEGDEIAASEVFLLDSEASIKGNSSMISISDKKNHFDDKYEKILQSYLDLKNVLAFSDPHLIKNKAKELKNNLKILNKINSNELEEIYIKTEEGLDVLLKANSLKERDLGFSMISEKILKLVDKVGSKKTLYKDYCPMALDNKGAYWLSEIQEIQNPFFGGKMPKCGSVKEVYEEDVPSKSNKTQGHHH